MKLINCRFEITKTLCWWQIDGFQEKKLELPFWAKQRQVSKQVETCFLDAFRQWINTSRKNGSDYSSNKCSVSICSVGHHGYEQSPSSCSYLERSAEMFYSADNEFHRSHQSCRPSDRAHDRTLFRSLLLCGLFPRHRGSLKCFKQALRCRKYYFHSGYQLFFPDSLSLIVVSICGNEMPS